MTEKSNEAGAAVLRYRIHGVPTWHKDATQSGFGAAVICVDRVADPVVHLVDPMSEWVRAADQDAALRAKDARIVELEAEQSRWALPVDLHDELHQVLTNHSIPSRSNDHASLMSDLFAFFRRAARQSPDPEIRAALTAAVRERDALQAWKDSALQTIAQTDVLHGVLKDEGRYLGWNVCEAAADWLAQLRDDLTLAERERDEAKEQPPMPCKVCLWPGPVAPNEGDICPCCGFEAGFDDVEVYRWDGRWWSSAQQQPPLIEHLDAARLQAESERQKLKEADEGWQTAENELAMEQSLRQAAERTCATLCETAAIDTEYIDRLEAQIIDLKEAAGGLVVNVPPKE